MFLAPLSRSKDTFHFSFAITLDLLLVSSLLFPLPWILRCVSLIFLVNLVQRRRKQSDLGAVTSQKSMREYALPDITSLGSSIVWPTITATHYKIKPLFLNFISQDQFSSTDLECPLTHLEEFMGKCATTMDIGITDEQLRMICFPYSLQGEARDWLRVEDKGKYATWEALVQDFTFHFLPPAKVAKLQNAILQFHQEERNTLYEAWVRYKELQRRCPHHGLPEWLMCYIF